MSSKQIKSSKAPVTTKKPAYTSVTKKETTEKYDDKKTILPVYTMDNIYYEYKKETFGTGNLTINEIDKLMEENNIGFSLQKPSNPSNPTIYIYISTIKRVNDVVHVTPFKFTHNNDIKPLYSLSFGPKNQDDPQKSSSTTMESKNYLVNDARFVDTKFLDLLKKLNDYLVKLVKKYQSGDDMIIDDKFITGFHNTNYGETYPELQLRKKPMPEDKHNVVVSLKLNPLSFGKDNKNAKHLSNVYLRGFKVVGNNKMEITNTKAKYTDDEGNEVEESNQTIGQHLYGGVRVYSSEYYVSGTITQKIKIKLEAGNMDVEHPPKSNDTRKADKKVITMDEVDSKSYMEKLEELKNSNNESQSEALPEDTIVNDLIDE